MMFGARQNCASARSSANCSPVSQRRLSTSTICAQGSTPPKPVAAMARNPRNNSESVGTSGLAIADGDSGMRRNHSDRRAPFNETSLLHTSHCEHREEPRLFPRVVSVQSCNFASRERGSKKGVWDETQIIDDRRSHRIDGRHERRLGTDRWRRTTTAAHAEFSPRSWGTKGRRKP